MKTTGILLIVFGSIFAIGRGILRVYVNYEYANKIECNWDLADRASTLAQKAEYIDKFVKALEDCKLEGTNSALFLETPETDFNENMKALKSLQSRLIQISNMSETDFAYQTALQQITAQEQGEAHEMLHHLEDCWQRQNHPTIWNWLLAVVFFIIQALMIILGVAIFNNKD